MVISWVLFYNTLSIVKTQFVIEILYRWVCLLFFCFGFVSSYLWVLGRGGRGGLISKGCFLLVVNVQLTSVFVFSYSGKGERMINQIFFFFFLCKQMKLQYVWQHRSRASGTWFYLDMVGFLLVISLTGFGKESLWRFYSYFHSFKMAKSFKSLCLQWSSYFIAM